MSQSKLTNKTYWIVLECGNVSLDCLFHVPSCHKGCCQIYVAVNKVGFQPDGVPVVFKRLLKLSTFLKHISQVAVGLGQKWILFDGQSTEVGRSGDTTPKIRTRDQECQGSIYLSSLRHWKWIEERRSRTPVLLVSCLQSCMQCRSAFS